MKRIYTLFSLLALSLVLCSPSCSKESGKGGSSWDEINGSLGPDDSIKVPDSAYFAAGCTERNRQTAEEWRAAACHKNTRNAAWVYTAMVTKYADAPEKLAARLQVLGFRDVYLSCPKTMYDNADKWLKTFVSCCHSASMKVHAVRISSNELLLNPSDVLKEVAIISGYNSKVSQAERLDGIAADLEVHIAKEGKVPGLAYAWNSSTGYGVGKDNDQLLRLGLEVLDKDSKACNEANLQLSEAISYAYQSHFDTGELSYGSTPQFLSSCQWVSIMAYLSTKESIWQKSEPILKAADRGASVSIAYKTAVNNVDSPSLQPKGWDYLLETSRYLNTNALTYRAYRGIDVFTYEGLENMWLAQ